MISQKAKYALRALVALARSETGSMMIGQIAAQQKIPRKFLEQILLELKRDGLLASRRGKFGGYGLLKPAEQITFGHVLRLIDGPLAPLPCLSRIAYRRCSDCADEDGCEIRRVFCRRGRIGARRSRSHHPCRRHCRSYFGLDECGGQTRDPSGTNFCHRLRTRKGNLFTITTN